MKNQHRISNVVSLGLFLFAFHATPTPASAAENMTTNSKLIATKTNDGREFSSLATSDVEKLSDEEVYRYFSWWKNERERDYLSLQKQLNVDIGVFNKNVNFYTEIKRHTEILSQAIYKIKPILLVKKDITGLSDPSYQGRPNLDQLHKLILPTTLVDGEPVKKEDVSDIVEIGNGSVYFALVDSQTMSLIIKTANILKTACCVKEDNRDKIAITLLAQYKQTAYDLTVAKYDAEIKKMQAERKAGDEKETISYAQSIAMNYLEILSEGNRGLGRHYFEKTIWDTRNRLIDIRNQNINALKPLFDRIDYILVSGFLDQEAKAVPFAPKYDSEIEGWGWTDLEGKWVINPQKLHGIFEFSNGVAHIAKKVPNIKQAIQGILDKSGKTLWLDEGVFPSGEFSDNGLIKVETKNKKIGYMNTSGKMVLPAIYDVGSSNFSDGVAAVNVNNEKCIYINSNAKKLFEGGKPDKYGNDYWCFSFFSEGLSSFEEKLDSKDSPKVDLSTLQSVMNGSTNLVYHQKVGFMDKTGKIVIPAIFDAKGAQGFFHGFASLAIDGKFGLIDKTGKKLTKFIYKSPLLVRNDLARIELNDKYGFVNKQGNTVMPPQFVEASDFLNSGVAFVKKDNSYYFIDKNGKIVP